MINDPIVEEVREIRRKIMEQCGNDLDKYYQHILKLQENYKDRLVKPKRKLIVSGKKAALGGVVVGTPADH